MLHLDSPAGIPPGTADAFCGHTYGRMYVVSPTTLNFLAPANQITTLAPINTTTKQPSVKRMTHVDTASYSLVFLHSRANRVSGE